MDYVDIHTNYDGVLWGTVFLECDRCGHEFRMTHDGVEYQVPRCPQCRHDGAWWKAQVTCASCNGSGKVRRYHEHGFDRVTCPQCGGQERTNIYLYAHGAKINVKSIRYPWREHPDCPPGGWGAKP